MKRISIIILFVLYYHSACLAIDRRSRAEGIPGIMASNTIGLGNIIFSAGIQSYFQLDTISTSSVYELLGEQYENGELMSDSINTVHKERSILFSPVIVGTAGLTSFFHLSVSTVPWTGYKIGNSTAKLKFTIPGNDNLRIMGYGGSFNITLATEENIIAVQKETPTFSPIFSFTAIADVDLIKKYPEFPVKLYLNYSTLDNVNTHQYYQQHSAKAGLEIKEEKYSLYCKFGAALYKDRDSDKYFTPLTEAGFGYKKRFTGAWPFSLTADIEFDPVHPIAFLDEPLYKSPKISFSFTMPIYYKETNAEALRTLIFVERNRKKSHLVNRVLKSKKTEEAVPLYNKFIRQLSDTLGKPVMTGEFGADMQVSSVNDGPVTIVLDSENR